MRTLSPRTCPCGRTFLVPSYRGGKYCSLECSGKMHSKRVEMTCDNCGTVFTRIPSKIRSTLAFCGRECQAEAKRIDTNILPVRRDGWGMKSYRSRALRLLGQIGRAHVCT